MAKLEPGPNQIVFTRSELEEIIEKSKDISTVHNEIIEEFSKHESTKISIGEAVMKLSFQKNNKDFHLDTLKQRSDGGKTNFPRIRNIGLDMSTGYITKAIKYLMGEIIDYENNSVVTDIFDRFVIIEKETLKESDLYEKEKRRVLDEFAKLEHNFTNYYLSINLTKDADKLLKLLDKCEKDFCPNPDPRHYYETVIEYLNVFPDKNGDLYAFNLPGVVFTHKNVDKHSSDFDMKFVKAIENRKSGISLYYSRYMAIDDMESKTRFVVYSLEGLYGRNRNRI